MAKKIKVYGRKIRVTAADIRKGKRGSCKRCPIALALRRVFPSAVCVDVTYSTAWVDFENASGTRIELPVKASEFIFQFDKREKVKPFEFVTRR